MGKRKCEWAETARALRAAGWTLQAIGERFGVTAQRAQQVCAGIKCPVDHKAAHQKKMSALFRDPEWRRAHMIYPEPTRRLETADFIRDHYGRISAREIGERLGISKNAVIGRARDMGLSKSREASNA